MDTRRHEVAADLVQWLDSLPTLEPQLQVSSQVAASAWEVTVRLPLGAMSIQPTADGERLLAALDGSARDAIDMSGCLGQICAQLGSALPPAPGFVLLHVLPPRHVLRAAPLGALAAQCRNKLGKEWRPVHRWRIASSGYDQLGPSWTETSEFRVPACWLRAEQRVGRQSGVSP